MSQYQVSFRPHLLVYDRKFNVALRKSHGVNFIKRLEQNSVLTNDEKLLFKNAELNKYEIDKSNIIINTNIYPCMLKQMLNFYSVNNNSVKEFKNVTTLMAEYCNIQLGWITENSHNIFKQGIPNYNNETQNSIGTRKELINLYHFEKIFRKLVDLLPNTEIRKHQDETSTNYSIRLAKQCIYKIPELSCIIIWSKLSCFIYWSDNWYFFPRSYLLMVHNKISDLTSVLVLSACTPNTIYSGTDIYTTTIQFIHEYCNLAICYKQKFFNISKVLEGLIIAETLIQLEGSQNSYFLSSITSMLEESTSFIYENSVLQSILLEASVELRHELGCLSKIIGHPFCDIEQGAEDLYRKTHEAKNISMVNVLKSVRYAKKEFIRNYIFKHGKWPSVKLSPDASISIQYAIARNLDPDSSQITKKYKMIDLTDYDDIEINKLLEFDYIDNFIPYVKDRTVSLLKNKIFRQYIEKTELKHDRNSWKETRLLLLYLMLPEDKTNHRWFMEIFESGDWEQILNYMVFRLVPKEKEHKISARTYACKTLQDRARGVVQEHNTANFLNKYSTEEAMTPTELQLIRKIYSFRNMKKAYVGYRQIIVNVDASSWNNRFRDEAMAPLLVGTLDKIFDKKSFSLIQKAYQHTFYYLPDQDKVYYWNGQDGGIDGLNQYTWSYVYINQIKVCLEKFPYNYHILCKGDDLRVTIMVPPQVLEEKSIEDIKKDLMITLDREGKTFGHEIKIDDSYASEEYFVFSKNAYARGVEQPQTYRKIQKCYGANNAFITSVDDYIASSFSNAHSASRTSPSPLNCFNVALYWSFSYLVQDVVYSKLKRNELIALLLIPNLLGGFPIIYLHNFFARAESDLLPPVIDLLIYTEKYYPHISSEMRKWFYHELSDIRLSFEGFLSDPYSLPITRPVSPNTLLRKALTDILCRTTKNAALRELFESMNDGNHDAIISSLFSANVYNGKLFSVIFACTPVAIINEMIRKFESGRSVCDAIILSSSRGKGRNVLKKAFIQLNKMKHYRVNKFTTYNQENNKDLLITLKDTHCPYQIAQSIREYCWNKKIESVTHPPLQHFLEIGPIEMFNKNRNRHPNHDDNHHFEYHFNTKVETYDRNKSLLFTLGPHKPFLGATTGSGLAPPQIKFLANNIFISKIYGLMDVYIWSQYTLLTDEGPITGNLHELARVLLESYIGKDINTILPFASKKQTANTIQHHVRSRQYKISIVPNTLQNIYTRCIGDSHSHTKFAEAIEHYKVNFLHVYCHMVSVWALPMWLGQGNKHQFEKLWAVTTPCSECTQPIHETPVILSKVYKGKVLITRTTKIGQEALNSIMEEITAYEPPDYYIPDDETKDLTIELAQTALIQSYCDERLHHRTSLQNLLTQHTVTMQGLDTLSGWCNLLSKETVQFNDLRRINVSKLFPELAWVVSSYIIRDFEYEHPDLLIPIMSTKPSEEHAWLPLLADMYDSGIFYSLTNYIKELYPDLTYPSYDSPKSFSPIFGYACYLYTSAHHHHSWKIAYLKDHYDSQSDNVLKNKLNTLKWHIYNRDYMTPLINALRSIKYKIDNKYAPLHILILKCIMFSLTDNIDFVLQQININELFSEKIIVVPIVPIIEEPYDYIADFMIGLFEENNEFLNRLKIFCNETDILATLDWYTTQNEDDIENEEKRVIVTNILDELNAYTIEVYQSSPLVCSNIIRRYVNPSPNYLDIPVYTNASGVTTMKRLPDSSIIDISITGKCYDYHTRQSICVPQIELPEWDNTLFNLRWFRRPYGSSNISISKLLYLLQSISIETLPSNSTYICLADGYGGYTSVISCMTQNSNIIYNTYPNNLGCNPKATTASAISRDNNNILDHSLISTGHYDITEIPTWNHIEKITKSFAIITCDAEAAELRSGNRILMFKYFGIYFCRNASTNSIGIFKAYVSEINMVRRLIAYCNKHCSQIYVCRSPSSPLNGEIYVVLQFIGENSNDNYSDTNFDIIPSQSVDQSLTTFCDKYILDISEDKDGTDNLRLLNDLDTFILKYMRILPNYGLSKYQEVAKVMLPSHLLFQNDMDYVVWLNQVLHFNLRATSVMIHDLERSLNEIGRNLSHYRHCIVITNRLISIYGFIDVLKLYIDYAQTKSIPILRSHEFRCKFDNMIRSIPVRLNYKTMTDEMTYTSIEWYKDIMYNRYKVHGVLVNPFKEYKLGARWAVCFIEARRNMNNE